MVIDTMIFVYALLDEPTFGADSGAVLKAASPILVPDSFRAEFVNTLWQWVRHRGVEYGDARAALRDAEHLIARTGSSRRLARRALELAIQVGHPAYDTLFVALAEREGTQLITYDAKLLAAFPKIAMAPAEFLASP